MQITQVKSPNFTPGTRKKIGFIIHGTLGNYEGAVQWLCTPPESRPVVSYSSAHYVIAKDGRVSQLVQEKDVAWHAGNVSNPTEYAKKYLPIENGKILNPNESFIGIELEWFVNDAITEPQYQAISTLISGSGISNPVILCHKEVTDYKADFHLSLIEEVKKRLVQVSPPIVATIADKKAQIIKLINEL